MSRSRTILVALLASAPALLDAADTAAAKERLRAPVTVRVENSSGRVIRRAYVSPSGTPEWGKNVLARPLAPGKTATLAANAGCRTYDIRLVADGGTEYLDEEVALCGADQVLDVGGSALTLARSARTQ